MVTQVVRKPEIPQKNLNESYLDICSQQLFDLVNLIHIFVLGILENVFLCFFGGRKVSQKVTSSTDAAIQTAHKAIQKQENTTPIQSERVQQIETSVPIGEPIPISQRKLVEIHQPQEEVGVEPELEGQIPQQQEKELIEKQGIARVFQKEMLPNEEQIIPLVHEEERIQPPLDASQVEQRGGGLQVLVQGTGVQLNQNKASVWAVLEAFIRFKSRVFNQEAISPQEMDELLQDVNDWYLGYTKLCMADPRRILNLRNPEHLSILIEHTFDFAVTLSEVNPLSIHIQNILNFACAFQQGCLSVFFNRETYEAHGLFVRHVPGGECELYEFNPFGNGSIRQITSNQHDPRPYLSMLVWRD